MLDSLGTRIASRRGLAARLFLFAAAAVGVWYALPTLALGATGSDFSHSLLGAFARMHHISSGEAYWRIFTADSGARGALSPLRVLPLAIWLLHPDERIVRIIQVVLIGVNVATFAWIARKVEGVGYACIATVLLLASLQLRKWHDPVADDALVLPLTVQFVLLAAGACFEYARRRSAKLLIAAFTCSLLAALMDPTGIAGAVSLAVMVPLIERGRARVLLSAVFTVAALMGALPTLTAGVHPKFSEVVRSVAPQIVGALPASYRALAGLVPDKIVAFAYDSRFDVIPSAGLIDTLIAIALAICAGAGLYYVTRTRRDATSIRLGIFGLALWITAALVSIPSAAHALPWGEAFGGVYLESFGFAFFVAALLQWFVRRNFGAEGTTGAVLCAAIGLCAFALLIGNVRFAKLVVARDQSPLTFRYVLSRAGQAGLFDIVPAGATISMSPKAFAQYDLTDAGYDSAQTFLYAVSGRAFHVIEDRPTRKVAVGEWVLRTQITPGLHQITLAQVESLKSNVPWVSRGVIYLSAFSADALKLEPLAQKGASLPGLREGIHDVGARSLVAHIDRTCGAVRVSDISKPDAAAVSFGSGFQRRFPGDLDVRLVAAVPLAFDDPNWRYGARHATLNVQPGQCRAKAITLDTDVYTREPGLLRISYGGQREQLPVSQAGTHVHVVLSAKHGSAVTFFTTSSALDADLRAPRYDYAGWQSANMLVVHPIVAAEKK